MPLRGLSCGSFLWKTTALASTGSACWSITLSAKVTLWFSKEKGGKAQGKWNATLGCKTLVLKIIKDASRFRRSLISEPRKGCGGGSDSSQIPGPHKGYFVGLWTCAFSWEVGAWLSADPKRGSQFNRWRRFSLLKKTQQNTLNGKELKNRANLTIWTPGTTALV